MEKKNTILLTVIAIATLLVAVVGATFAYFSATGTTDNTENNTTTVTTNALASAVMNMGDEVKGENVYPGFKAVKSVTVTGACPVGNDTCKNVDATIKVTENIPEVFGDDVTWTLYKSATPITCTGSDSITNGENGEVQHSASYTCTDTTGAEEVISSDDVTGTTAKANISVANGTNDNYYLVVNYANDGEQNAQQGKAFSVALDFVPTAK